MAVRGAKRRWTAATIAGAAVVGGLVWGFLTPGKDQDPVERASWYAGIAGALVAVVLTFRWVWLWHAERKAVQQEADAEQAAKSEQEAQTERTLRLYLQQLRDRCQRVELERLMPDQDEHPVMLLSEVFVSQLVRDNPPPSELLELPREVLLRLAGTGALEAPAELPEGVDQVRLEQARLAYRDRPTRPVLAAVAAAAAGVVVLGDPGAGKSTLTRYLMLALAADALNTAPEAATGSGARGGPVLAGDLAGRLPLLVELRQFADARWRDADFLDFWNHLYQSEGFGLPRELLQQRLTDGRVLVVFDGLDEIFEAKHRNQIARRIQWFARSYPQARVVVTSRVIGYDRAVFDRAGFTTLMLQDLTRQQITQFVTAWFQRSCPDPTEALRLRNRVLKAVKNAPAVAELAGNPMLLTILSIIARRRELPRDRRRVYQHAVHLLIDQWDVNKELADQHPDMPHLTLEDKLGMLHEVARRMQDGPAGLAGNHLPGDDLTTLFRAYLARELRLSDERAVQAARTMLAQLRDRNFILASYGAGLYGFVHRAFLEYLAANDISQRFADHELTEEELISVYTTHRAEPAWTEVLLLLARMIPPRFAAAVIDRLLEADLGWRIHSTPPHHLLLALRIAAEIERGPELAARGRTLTLTFIGLFQNTSGGPQPNWEADIHGGLAPLLNTSPGGWVLDHGLLRRWYASRPGFRDKGRFVMRFLATPAQPKADLMNAALHDEERDVRRAALQALGAGWAGDPETYAWLRDLATHARAADLRRAALDAVGAGWAGDPEALSLLRDRATEDENATVRRAAVQAIGAGWLGDPEALSFLRDRATHDQDTLVRWFAVDAIGAGWPGAPDTLDFLRDRIHDHNAEVRQTAAGVIAPGWTGYPETFVWLRDRATEDENTAVRRAAVQAIGAGWPGDPEALSLLRDRATEDENATVRRAAVQAIGAGWPGDPQALSLLRDRATHDQDTEVQGIALRWVGAGWADDSEAFAWLCGRATEDENATVRRAAVQAIGAGWPGDLQALDLLRDRATHDEAHGVRATALRWVGAGWADDSEAFAWLCGRATEDENATV
ncbi:HEAT repeat domain-containing protein, partial [Actinomadura sp. NPDC000600]|uniref:HEAT repeat domain-containing protein n=1 Tax=Actinomadura sp. NPDC000600 TaxID=3154262 RepID=UPI003397C918